MARFRVVGCGPAAAGAPSGGVGIVRAIDLKGGDSTVYEAVVVVEWPDFGQAISEGSFPSPDKATS